jgi:hypothetical protein
MNRLRVSARPNAPDLIRSPDDQCAAAGGPGAGPGHAEGNP